MITIRNGAGNSLQRDRNGFTTLGAILHDASLQAALGFGPNTEGRVSGLAGDDNTPVPDGAIVDLVPKASSKA